MFEYEYENIRIDFFLANTNTNIFGTKQIPIQFEPLGSKGIFASKYAGIYNRAHLLDGELRMGKMRRKYILINMHYLYFGFLQAQYKCCLNNFKYISI